MFDQPVPARTTEVATPSPRRSLRLDPEPRVVGAARRFLRTTLVDAGRSTWIDAAQLAVSELVTNSVLHANTPIEVSVEVGATTVRVEVRDDSPVLPMPRHWGETATTGRGLALVRAITSDSGVEMVDGGGKCVWFVIEGESFGETPFEPGNGDPTAAFDPALDAEPGQDVRARVAEDGTEVDLLAMPVLLWLAAQEHHEAVLRELHLLAADAGLPSLPGLPGLSPAALVAASQASSVLSSAVLAATRAALARGVEVVRLPPGHPSPIPKVPIRVDVALCVEPQEHDGFGALQDALDVGMRLGVAEQLLIRPALPEVVALRDWACEQVLAQTNGVPAAPWGAAAGPDLDSPDLEAALLPHPPSWDAGLVTGSEKVAIAADDSNRIAAISPAAARLLGWTPEELAGRRVVTIVPPHLREAHVAGFTRHLTTGQAHVLGVPVDLPVLCRDGRERLCRFVIDRVPAEAGRAVYVAWLTPLD